MSIEYKTDPLLVQPTICGQTRILKEENFFQLTEIVNLENISHLRFNGYQSIVFDQDNLAILHVCLYYCIKMENNLDIKGLDGHYHKVLGGVYVSKMFNLDISKFAQMCSLCLDVSFEKCAYMIYYLIYGRLATKSYINSLINQSTYPKNSSKDKPKPALSLKTSKNSKSNESTGRFEKKTEERDDQSLLQKVEEDLKLIFHSEPEKNNLTKFVVSEPSVYEKEDIWGSWDLDPTDKNYLSKKVEQKYYMSFFPNRVANNEKSAIFETTSDPFKKNYRLMRKKKFDDTKIDKMLDSVFNCSERFPFTEMSKVENVQTVRTERSKIFTYNVRKTNDKFKNCSIELDKIRHIITHKSKRKNQTSYKKEQFVGQHEREYSSFLKRMSEKNEQSFKLENPVQDSDDYDSENLFTNLVRKENGKERRFKKSAEYNESGRKVAVTSFLSSIPNSNSKTINPFECQNRVIQYKNEYRKFMKAHLFHRGPEDRGIIL